MSVAELLRAALPSLHPAERSVARTLLSDYPAAGLQTVARLAAQSQVSGPTVLRLTERLGFSAYADFQETLRGELKQRLQSPLDQLQPPDDESDPLQRARYRFADNVTRTFDHLDPREYERAAELLSSPRRRVFSTGGRFSALPARSLALHLQIARAGVTFLSAEHRTAMVLDFRPQDVLFVIDLRRYQKSTATFGRAAAARGVRLVLLTDQWLSPLAADADVVLRCALDAPSAFDSLVGANVVVETLLAGVLERLGNAPRPRMRAYDAAWAASDFPDTAHPGGAARSDDPSPAEDDRPEAHQQEEDA